MTTVVYRIHDSSGEIHTVKNPEYTSVIGALSKQGYLVTSEVRAD